MLKGLISIIANAAYILVVIFLLSVFLLPFLYSALLLIYLSFFNLTAA